MTTKEKTCGERVSENWQDRKADLEKLIELEQEGNEESDPDIGTLNEYGLCFDYVPPGTFNDQEEGFWRYQLSCGGPQDEIRFYSSDQKTLYKAEYWFLDWGDGAKKHVKDEEVVRYLWDMFVEYESVKAEYDKAINE